jgi:plasmid stabilization system protein ParE
MSVRWTKGAVENLLEIEAWIAEDDPGAAERWIELLRDRMKLAALYPNAGRIVPEFGLRNVREVSLRKYRIVYEVLPTSIHVLAVFEGSRLLDDADLPQESED